MLGINARLSEKAPCGNGLIADFNRRPGPCCWEDATRGKTET